MIKQSLYHCSVRSATKNGTKPINIDVVCLPCSCVSFNGGVELFIRSDDWEIVNSRRIDRWRGFRSWMKHELGFYFFPQFVSRLFLVPVSARDENLLIVLLECIR